MPRIARKIFKSGFFHIIIQGINKEYIFNKSKNKEKYLYLMRKYYEMYDIKIVAYCIMDNHAHFIIYTDDIKEISEYMHKINTIYAMEYNRTNGRVGYLFRDRYKSQYIYDRDYLFKCIKYIHMNPVKAKLVGKEEEYKYSSYNNFKNKDGYVENQVIELVFRDKKDYINLFNNIDDIDVEIMEIDSENSNLEIAVNKYLNRNKIELDDIKKSKIYLYNFSMELVNKGYKQKQIAEILQMNPSRISKILNR